MAEYTGEIKPLEKQSSGAREYTGDVIPFGGQPETPKPDTGLGARGAQRRYREAITEGAPELAAGRAYEGPSFAGERRTPEQLAQEWKEFGKGAAVGVPAGAVGLPGDIADILAAGAQKVFPSVEEYRGYIPTTEKIGTFIAGEPETKEEKLGRTTGAFFGPGALGRALRLGVVGAVGRPNVEVARVAQQAENMGFRLEPSMLTQAKPTKTPGFAAAAERNQDIANRSASRATGVETPEITAQTLGNRQAQLANEFEDIYIGPNRASPHQLRVDVNALRGLEQIERLESQVAPAAVTKARDAARNILERYGAAQQLFPGQRITSIRVPGDVLQRLRTEMSTVVRKATDNPDRYQALQVLQDIDGTIARNHPNLAARLAVANPQYRSTMTLLDLLEKGGIQRGQISAEKLGDWMLTHDPYFRTGRSTHPLAQLGEIGRTLGLRARWEGVSKGEKEAVEALLGKAGTLGKTAIGLRTQAARRAQRNEPLLGDAGRAAGVPSVVEQAVPKETE